jgi:hypothetical protein
MLKVLQKHNAGRRWAGTFGSRKTAGVAEQTLRPFKFVEVAKNGFDGRVGKMRGFFHKRIYGTNIFAPVEAKVERLFHTLSSFVQKLHSVVIKTRLSIKRFTGFFQDPLFSFESNNNLVIRVRFNFWSRNLSEIDMRCIRRNIIEGK